MNPAEIYNPTVYLGEEWPQSLEYTREWNERALYAVLAILGKPSSFLDVGCGDGSLVLLMRHVVKGACYGVELKRSMTNLIVEADLRDQMDLGECADLVISWEVGEHLPAVSAETFCDNVTRHVGEWLVFTAAQPEQGGDHHINEQPKEYWREMIEARELRYAQDETDHLAEAWRWATGPCFWLPANVQVFRR